ncbi:fatty acid desaturase [Nostoc sp. FACHB-152]|uniref:beta-carotene ketolase CrtW n=1 Tax=unclassified Nostoc TaxID=2593658 RepID=UPI0016822DF3|nr:MULTISPECIES: fatty acid desaturase [unclassified Nostoc]MBD2451763.1 fatty acid desaturase [Nostoc sp. FACHB-152]MBD2472874.1 fatty acid desaturase [Nostoc sp. FACHB-145]
MNQSKIAPLKEKKFNYIRIVKSEENILDQGLLYAISIISLWTISLIILLTVDISKTPFWLIGIGIVWQTFLYAGLFITAHDAMHGLVFTKNPKINNLIGSVCVTLYGLFSYKDLVQKHWLHHKYPSSQHDPDFHDHQHKNFWAWYFRFMGNYGTWKQLVGWTVIFNFLRFILDLSPINLILFWCLPSLLSSIQLFYFGTYLTHREPKEGYTNPHRAQTVALPVFWSFITSYHFVYHQEHHEYPQVPWWKLPEVRRKNADVSLN